jgi:starch-binding outer membrane protein, SusD/RagB family
MINKFTRTAGPASGGTTRLRARAGLTAGLAAVALIGLSACKDSTVPNFRSPQINPGTAAGIQFLVTGVVAGMRTDIGQDILGMSSFAREVGVFTATDQRFITEWMGNGTPIPISDFYGSGGWSNEFRIAKDADFVITSVPKVTPAYSAKDASLITGVMKTFEAYNMMLVAETRDTNGVPIAGFVAPTSTPAPILCIKDVWGGIAAMLDSGEADLDAGAPAGGLNGPLPVKLPIGFAAADSAGASGTVGTFAGFNRALAAYAKLQQAYAVARSPGGTPPTPTTPGSPLASALTSADAAIHATFLFNPAALGPPTSGDFADPLAVYHSYSSASGDQVNPVTFSVGQTTNVFVLDTVADEIAAGGDNRAVKLIVNSANPTSPCTGCNDIVVKHMTLGFYQTASSPIPIIRNEELVLIEAMIQLGLGNFSNAVTSINAVRTNVGGVAGYAGALAYVPIRDQILHELRASNIGEPGEERIMAVRNYGLQGPTTTTWGSTDTHATVLPIPISESGPRNGNITRSCP